MLPEDAYCGICGEPIKPSESYCKEHQEAIERYEMYAENEKKRPDDTIRDQ